ncbi:MAG: transglycosylase SLT domain-containing protein [Burkholderiaceae bacterium]
MALIGLLIVGGCATGPYDSSITSTNNGRTPPVETGTVPVDQPVNTASPAPQASNPAAARYALPRSPGSANVGSIVVTNPLAPRTVDLTAHPDDIWDRVRTGFAIPNIDSPLVAEQQAWYLSHPDYLRRAVDRSSLYLYHVVEELNKRGMPTELALLPFVESAYNPMAYSRAHASGMWQFIPGTGKTYNLKQDWWRDERRDVLASTDAALTYLKAIYEMHGDWHLALASYNWGEGSVKRAIERNQAAGLPTDYLSLSMPDETRNYVPKLQALKNIIANPEAFGVTLPRIDNQPYFAVVERSRDIDVRTAARLADMSLEDFKALNPSFNRPVIRASGTPLLVPANRESAFRNGLESEPPLATWQAHTVARKETVESIAARYGMTAAALREANGLGARGRVKQGQGLLVQKKGPGDVKLRFASFNPPTDGGVLLTTAIQASPSTYQVKRGDTLVSISRATGVAIDHLRSLNHLRSTGVMVGQKLQLATNPVVQKGGKTTSPVRAVAKPAARKQVSERSSNAENVQHHSAMARR